MSAFMWRKNPIIALIFYLEFMAAFTSPLILFTVYVFTPIWLHDFFLPMLYLFGQVLIGLAAGLDFKAREKETKDWKYNMLMNVILSLFLVWLIIPAIWTIREKKIDTLSSRDARAEINSLPINVIQLNNNCSNKTH